MAVVSKVVEQRVAVKVGMTGVEVLEAATTVEDAQVAETLGEEVKAVVQMAASVEELMEEKMVVVPGAAVVSAVVR